MSIQQPLATDNLDSPSHSLSHRVIANDDSAPVQSIVIDADGDVGIGTINPATPLEILKTSSANVVDMLKLRNSADAVGTGAAILFSVISDGQSMARIIANRTNTGGAGGTDLVFETYKVGYGGTDERMRITGEGKVGIGTAGPTAKLDVNSDIIRLRTAKTPASAGASGNAGDICWDTNYIYICVATNTWKRVAIATWS